MIARIALDRPVDANGAPIFPNMEAYDTVTGARLGRVGLLRTDGIFIVTGVNGQGVRLPAESIAVTWDLPRLDSICDVCDAATADAIEHEVPGTGGETVTLCPDCATRDTIVNGVTLNAARDLMPVKMRRQDDGNWIVWASDRRIVDIEPNGPAFDVWAKADMLTGERAVIFTGKSISAVSAWLTETFQLDIENLTPEPTPPAADVMAEMVDYARDMSGVYDRTGYPACVDCGRTDTRTVNVKYGDEKRRCLATCAPAYAKQYQAERNAKKQAEYASIPAIGGGSHEADTFTAIKDDDGSTSDQATMQDAVKIAAAMIDFAEPTATATIARPDTVACQITRGAKHGPTMPAPRNQATSQKRDNQRAERAALNEAYKAAATNQASEVADVLTAFGFTVASTKDVDGTPVTIWQDTNPATIEGTDSAHIAHATIKQTPYSLRIYNGQPARLPRHGDAELINRVEHGWCASGEARGYAAGLADAILRLIETPDPYGLALDAIEAREAEQSAPTPAPDVMSGLLAEINAMTIPTPDLDAIRQRVAPVVAAEVAASHSESDRNLLAIGRTLNKKQDYTIAAPGHDGRPVIIAEVEHHDIPNPVLIGGQPSMSGPWQVPAMSGGSQDADTISCADCGITSDETDVQPATFSDRAPRCWECMAAYIAYTDRLTCHHNADEPPARFCSQCGHDRTPNAPQPTDTGTSHDVPTKYQTTCPTCDQRLIKTENWQQTCAATWSTPETLHGHTSAETAYLVDDYPYGARLRCQIRYWIESGKDGRQRFVSQTCNPKTGKWNNPKKSTYSEVMVMTIDSRGHIGYTALGSWPTECEMRHMETLLGEHITEAQAATMKTWRVMNQAQKHITYNVTSTGPLDIMHSAEDRATAAAFDATRQTKEEVNAIWNTAINRAVKELETA